MSKFLDAYNKADTAADIASATADALIQAYNSDDGMEKDSTQMVLMGIMENLNVIKSCLDQMYHDTKERREGAAI